VDWRTDDCSNMVSCWVADILYRGINIGTASTVFKLGGYSTDISEEAGYMMVLVFMPSAQSRRVGSSEKCIYELMEGHEMGGLANDVHGMYVSTIQHWWHSVLG